MNKLPREIGIYSRPDLIEFFRSFLGQPLREMWTVVFEFDGDVEDWTRANPEFIFDGGAFWCTVIFGDKLLVMPNRWKDEMVYITRDTFDFIRESGKYWKIDRSTEPPVSNLVGKRLERVILIDNSVGDVVGVELQFQDQVATFYVIADEYFFILGEARERLQELQYEYGEVIQ
jgi:hypothetical protein